MARAGLALPLLALACFAFAGPAAADGPVVATEPVSTNPVSINPCDPCAAPDPCTTCEPCPPCDPYPCCTCKEPKDPTCPPDYANRRFVENWRPCLCVPCCEKGDWTDRLKAMPLTRDKRLWVNVGGQVRFRYESLSGIGFGAPADDSDGWMLGRFRTHADVHFGEHVRVFVEGIYAGQWDEPELGPRPIDRNEGDLLNAFAEVMGDMGSSKASLWVGRRELETGKQRLVSPLDWANTRRTFEGAGVTWKQGPHAIDAWYTAPVVVVFDEFDESDDDRTFWGVDYTNASLDCLTWGAYVMGLDEDAVAKRPDQDRLTIGVRLDAKIPNTRFDVDAEAAYQTGEIGTGDISATMASITLGWKPCLRWDTKFAIGVDYASGDDDATDADVGTFHQLFPLGHKYFGHADLIGRQNLVAGRLEASTKPTDKVTLSAAYHLFRRAEAADGVYNAGGGSLRAVPVGGNSDKAIGSEIDVMIEYKLDRHWTAFAEWAHFMPGAFLENTGASDDFDAFYIGLQGTF
jgi:hypothetical protein